MRKPLSKALREKIKAKYDGHCGYCGCKPEKLYIDHMCSIERSHLYKGDINEEANLMPSCFSCNNYKNVFDVEGLRRELSQQIQRARTHSLNFRLAERFGQLTVHERPIVFYFEKKE